MANTAAAETPTALPDGPTPLLKPSRVTRHYDVSLWTLNKWVEKGCPVAKRLPNGDRRFSLPAVDAWLDEQAEGAEDRAAANSAAGVAARSA